jgi:hypothetical protein
MVFPIGCLQQRTNRLVLYLFQIRKTDRYKYLIYRAAQKEQHVYQCHLA